MMITGRENFHFSYRIDPSPFCFYASAGSTYNYFHSQLLAEVFPNSSASYSKTPTILLRKASFPVEDVLKNSEPVNLIFPGAVNRPIPCPVQVTISCQSLLISSPLPSPYIAPPGLGV